MRISVSGLIGAHPLYLARELASRSLLESYYTSLPLSRTSGVPPDRTHRHWALLFGMYAVSRGWIPGDKTRLQHLWSYEFDRWTAARLKRMDVMHALPGCGLKLRRVAKERFGALTVCDSGTSHERFQSELLHDEAARWGIECDQPSEQHLRHVEAEYEEADLILTPSTFARNSFIATGISPEKVAVTPYGADLHEYHPAAKRDDIFRILFVGSICIRKGVPHLFEAVSQLRFCDAEFCVRGASLAETSQLLRLYRGSIPLKLVEPQPRHAMSNLFNQASVLVLPSIEDGFGLVIGQAMACGIPVIASRNTGAPELIHDGVDGFVVDAKDSRALRDRLTFLYENPDICRNMGRAARATMERIGGWRTYGDAFVAACTAALARRSALSVAS